MCSDAIGKPVYGCFNEAGGDDDSTNRLRDAPSSIGARYMSMAVDALSAPGGTSPSVSAACKILIFKGKNIAQIRNYR